jgi:hypothetical protein
MRQAKRIAVISLIFALGVAAYAAENYSWDKDSARIPWSAASPWDKPEVFASANRPQRPALPMPGTTTTGSGGSGTSSGSDQQGGPYGLTPVDGEQQPKPVFQIQLWDAQKTNWTDASLDDLFASGFTVVQNGWSGSLLPSVSLVNKVNAHGLLYAAYINTRYLFSLRATAAEKAAVHYVTDASGKVSTVEINTLDPVYQQVVQRELARDLAVFRGNAGLAKVLLNSEHGTPVSYDDLTKAEAVEAGIMTAGLNLPPYSGGVSKLPSGSVPGGYADRVTFATWYENFGNDGAINRAAAIACHTVMPDLLMTTDPLGDTYTYGQYKGLDVLQDWVRVHQAPRDPLSIAYRVERMKAHLRHRATHPGEGSPEAQIWVGPQLGTMASSGNYAAPADMLEEALWLSVAFGARGTTFWGYNTVIRTNSLDADAWSRIPEFRASLLDDYPYLLLAKDAPRSVAVLLSKANQVLTTRAGYQVDDNYESFYRVALTAHVPCDVVYDEDVLEGRLARYKALILPGIEKSTPALDAAIAAFQANGGRVIKWPVLLPAYRDFMITQGKVNAAFSMTNPGSISYLPDQYRLWRQAQATRLYAAVGDLVDISCDNPNVIVNAVTSQGGSYVVVINDNRTYGDWTTARGYKWCEDEGLPSTANVTVGKGANAATYSVTLPAAGMTMVGY